MSRTQQGSSNWYQLDGSDAVYHSQEVTLHAADQTFTATAWTELTRDTRNCDELGVLIQEQTAKFVVVAYMETNGPSFEVRLYNLTDAAVLATISFTETTPTYKDATITIPDGTKTLVVEIRRVGTPSRVFHIKRAAIRLKVSP